MIAAPRPSGAGRPAPPTTVTSRKLAGSRPPLLSWRGCRCRWLQYRTGARRLVTARITPLRLEAFEQLPKHARRCVYWEVDPATLRADDHLSDPEFEKEAWLSMVMLEWGSCGQMAVQCRDSEAAIDEDPAMPFDIG